jgi:hypothetical protein
MSTRNANFLVFLLPSVLLFHCSATGDDPPNGVAPFADAGQVDAVLPLADAAGRASGVAFHFQDLSAGGAETHETLYGDLIGVHLTGLTPRADVTVRARTIGDDGQWYEAYATLTAGTDGTVDLASMAPSSGTYPGVDPDGLFWSGQAKPDPSDPTADPSTAYFRAEIDGTTVARARLLRYGRAKGITEVDVADNGLVGLFCAPATSAARGAIIAFGGSEGGLSSGKSMASK